MGLWRRRGDWHRPLPPARQLLSWMDSSATGWILLERNGTVGHINPRAERILQLDAGRLLVGQPFAEKNREWWLALEVSPHRTSAHSP